MVKFIHDCSHCKYLGGDDKYDFYIHIYPDDKYGFKNSIIARYGNDGPEYESMPSEIIADGMPSLLKAKKLAIKMGYLKEDSIKTIRQILLENEEAPTKVIEAFNKLNNKLDSDGNKLQWIYMNSQEHYEYEAGYCGRDLMMNDPNSDDEDDWVWTSSGKEFLKHTIKEIFDSLGVKYGWQVKREDKDIFTICLTIRKDELEKL